MADFACSVHGQFTSTLTWSFGVHVTSQATIDNLENAWDAAWNAAWNTVGGGMKQYYPTATSMEYTRVARLDPTLHELENRTLNTHRAGTAPGDTLPYLNAIVVRQRSGFTAKTNRGRFYLPAVEETFVNNNVVDPIAAANLGTQVRSVFSAIIADGSTFFVAPRKPPKSGVPLYTKTVINNWTVSGKPARQSRRVKKQVPIYY